MGRVRSSRALLLLLLVLGCRRCAVVVLPGLTEFPGLFPHLPQMLFHQIVDRSLRIHPVLSGLSRRRARQDLYALVDGLYCVNGEAALPDGVDDLVL